MLISRGQLALVERAIAATGERPARIFRRFRIDCIQQRDIASEMGVSLSTVEADLRKVRGVNSIYHNNGIQTWLVRSGGETENVEIG